MPALFVYNVGMKKDANEKKQYTVRGIPEHIDRLIRSQAKEHSMSLNSFLVKMLTDALSLFAETPDSIGKKIEFTDLDNLIGTWIEDPKFDEAICMQSQIDKEIW